MKNFESNNIINLLSTRPQVVFDKNSFGSFIEPVVVIKWRKLLLLSQQKKKKVGYWLLLRFFLQNTEDLMFCFA